MKKTILPFLLGCMLNVPIYAQNINFADANVKAICIAKWDANSDGELSEAEAAAVTSFRNTVFKNNTQITSFDEFQYFTGLTNIPMDAFYSCTGLTSIIIPDNVSTIGSYAFWNCSSLNNVTLPNSLENIGSYAFHECEKLPIPPLPSSLIIIGDCAFGYMGTPYSESQDLVIPDHVTSIGAAAFYGRKLKSVILGHSLENIGNHAFESGYNKIDEIRIPRSVTSIGELAFFSGDNHYPSRVIVENEIPFNITGESFRTGTGGAYKTLYVPIGSKAAYEAANNWQICFNEILEMKETVTLSSAGMGSFCSTRPLDFSGTDNIKAYIVSAFKPSTGEVTLTRITDVPANTGIVVKGDEDTYTIPWGPGETVVANMLVGVTTNTVLNKVDGDYTNYILAKKNGNLGFYAVSDGSTLSAGKAYLPLPTAQLPSGAGVRQMTMIFDDETTGIQQSISSVESNKDYYDLQGRRVSTPTRGLYIVNGKKVVIK